MIQRKRADNLDAVAAATAARAACMAMLCLLAPPLFAQSDAVTTSLRECYAITDDAVRVACYDALARQQGAMKPEATTAPAVSAVVSEPAPAPPVAAAPPPVPAPAAQATAAAPTQPEASGPSNAATEASARVAGFGQQATVTTEADDTEVMLDTVTRVVQVEPTKLQITLASGQVWRQTIGKTFIVREGERVRIRSTGWGKAYRLSVEGRPAFIQVSRTR